jgi:cell division transport system permease protein
MTRLIPILRDAVKGLRRNLAMTLAVVLCSAVSLTLFGAGLLLNRQVDITSKHLFGRVELTIYLNDDITGDQQAALATKLTHDPLVKTATYESKDQAFAEFKQLYKSEPELTEGVTADLLPASYHVKLVHPQDYGAAATEYKNAPGVNQVQDWRGRLKGFFRFLHGFQLAAYILAAVQGLATLVLLYNTIRMSAFSRRKETSIMRLVGATRFHIQLPFVLESALAGLAGGIIAAGALFGLRVALIDHRFSHQEFTPVLTHGDVWTVIGYVIVAGMVASSLMAFIALRRHVNAAEPKRPSRSLRKSIPPPRAGREEGPVKQPLAGAIVTYGPKGSTGVPGAHEPAGSHRRR